MYVTLAQTACALLAAAGFAALCPTRAEAYINAGFRSRQEYEEYLEKQHRKQFPNEVWARKQALENHTLALSRAGEGQWKEAIELYDRAIGLMERETSGWPVILCRLLLGRGDAYWETRRYFDALTDYRSALACAKMATLHEVRESYLRLAVAYAAVPDARLRDRAKSMAMGEAACKVFEDRQSKVESEAILAALHAAAGDFDSAIRVQSGIVERLRIVERLDPKSPVLGTVKAHLEQYRQGKTVWPFDPYLTGPADPRKPTQSEPRP